MFGLNLPPAHLRIKKQENKEYVFDRLRKQFVRLTPEEFVRQHFINYLIECKNYPEGLLANEVSIELGNLNRRCDTVLYDNFLQPRMIIEYKAPTVAIDQNAFDQIVRYNMSLQVTWLIVSNGLEHFCCHIDKEKGEYFFLKDIPLYNRLKN
ncbi:MAG: type I restriction enzyme HsdR N-terminal domain-containing protein [Dysgonamonadaceae bacterium]|jgi:predicted type IV restriction endonuclease|nr:type I restriction enzyme HsdR N-terminal domain-containing protein [Dysgonamonadaceae bacterium]